MQPLTPIERQQRHIDKLSATVNRLREGLEWIVRVNAMDYEYRAVAKEALGATSRQNLNAVKREALIKAAESLNHAQNFDGFLDFIIEYDALIEYANHRYPDKEQNRE